VLSSVSLILLIIALVIPHLLSISFATQEYIDIGIFKICLHVLNDKGSWLNECVKLSNDCTVHSFLYTMTLFKDCSYVPRIQVFAIGAAFVVPIAVVFQSLASSTPRYHKHGYRVIASICTLLAAFFLMTTMALAVKLNHSAYNSYALQYDVSFILITLDWCLLTLSSVPFLVNTVEMLKNPIRPLDAGLFNDVDIAAIDANFTNQP
jgi:hypothetical protein